jgi:hypothetical protein
MAERISSRCFALAADIEDVLLHNELDDDDTETLNDVVAEILKIGAEAQASENLTKEI